MSSVEEIRARRPREVVHARAVAVVAGVLWAPLLGHLSGASGVGSGGALLLVVYVAGAVGVAKGHHGGRVMMSAALPLLYLMLVPYCWLGFTDPYLNGPVYAVMDIAAVLLSVAGLLLAYDPRAGRYFHEVAAARAAR